MANKPRAPLTPGERQEMRDRVLRGESFLEVSRIYSCSPRTVEKCCTGLRVKKGGVGVAITNRQIEEIAQLRKEGMHIQQISRIVGVSVTSVTRYSPRELKSARSSVGGLGSAALKKKKWDEKLALLRASAPPIKPKPKHNDEIPDAVLRMTESFKMRGMRPEVARAEALRIYAKTKR